MQLVSPEFTAATSGPARRVRGYLEISWDNTGLISAARGGAGWTDETPYLVSHTGNLKINPPGDDLIPAGEVGSASITLDNSTHRFSWQRTDSPLYAYIGGATGPTGFKVRLWEGFVLPDESTEYVCIFTGAITGWQPRTASAEVIAQCRDIGWIYLQNKISSPNAATPAVYQIGHDQLPSTWINYVAGTLGGIDAGNMDLDVGIYHIPWLWLDDESIVEEIWEVAAADGGLAYFNQLGKLLYRTSISWVPVASSWDFTESTYETSDPAIDTDAVATKVVLEWSGRYPAAYTVLYEMMQQKTILPSDHLDWTARFEQAAYVVVSPTNTEDIQDYHFSSAGGIDLTGVVTVAISGICGQQCTVTATNASAKQAAILDYLCIRGMPLTGGPSEQAEVEANPKPFTFERKRSVRGNPYCQTIEQGKSLASLLALRCRRIRPLYQINGVPGVPQLELSDRATYYDKWAITNAVRDGLVVGIDWTGNEDGFWQTVSLLDVTDLLEYDNYFIIGTTALGDHGRCWY